VIVDIETTGLNPYRNHLVTINIKRGGHAHLWKRWEDPELVMIDEFLALLREVPSSEAIFGYNNLKFDVPFVASRCAELRGLDAATWQLLYGKKWVDLYQFLGDDYRSLESWLRRFGMERRVPVRGRDIPRLYRERKYELIEHYAREELDLCERLFRRLLHRFPALLGERLSGGISTLQAT
jgi:uncharacterized protein YprB with RNaseH-like and TPR domain